MRSYTSLKSKHYLRFTFTSRPLNLDVLFGQHLLDSGQTSVCLQGNKVSIFSANLLHLVVILLNRASKLKSEAPQGKHSLEYVQIYELFRTNRETQHYQDFLPDILLGLEALDRKLPRPTTEKQV